MTRLLELPDTHRDDADLTELVFAKAMKRINRLAAGDEAKRQALIVEMLEWFNSELDGEVQIILYESRDAR